MLEFFRRHRGPFLITLTVIIILAFGVWGAFTGLSNRNNVDPQAMAQERAFSVYGVDYTHQDVARLARLQRLAFSTGMYEFAFGLPDLARSQVSMSGGMDPTDFVSNLLILRDQAVKHGVAASDEDAKLEFQKLQPVQVAGKFDPAAAETFLNNLRANGFQPADLMDLIKDKLALDALRKIVGSNYTPSPLAVDKGYAAQEQVMKASVISFALEDFKKKAEVKDDEIKKYYDEKKDTFKTAEKRSAQIVTFERPKVDEARVAEDNAKITNEWEQLIGDFYNKVTAPGADLTKLVAEVNATMEARNKTILADDKNKAEAKKAEEAKKNPEAAKKDEPAKKEEAKPKEPVAPLIIAKVETISDAEFQNPPAVIKDEPAILKEMFRKSLQVGKLGDPIDSSKGHSFLKLTKVDAPRQQELKEVTDKIKETLLAQKAREAINTAVKEAKTTLEEGLKANKKLADLAKEKGWKVEDLAEFTTSKPPANRPDAADLAQAAAKTAVNAVSKPVSSETGDTLVVVTSKEVRKSETSTSAKDSEKQQLSRAGQEALMKAWFGKLKRDAKVNLYFGPGKAAEAEG